VVIDSGLARQPVFEPATGITRLETVRVSKAAADQRAGRAGRTEPGIAIRLWRAEQTAALAEFAPPEILAADLTGLVIDCAAWGVADPAALAFIDLPPQAALKEATRLLGELGALDRFGGLTGRGRRMRSLGLPVRLAAMVVAAGEAGDDVQAAARLAVLLGERGLGGTALDLDERLRRFVSETNPRAKAAKALAARMASEAREDRHKAGMATSMAGALLLPGFADRVAIARGNRGRFLMANGRGAVIDESERLAGADFVLVADLTGKAAAQRVLAAAEIDRATIEERLSDRIETVEDYGFDRESRSVRARRVRRLGAIVLDDAPRPLSDPAKTAATLADGVRLVGLQALPWDKAALQMRARLGFLNRTLGADWPEMSDEALLARLDIWFLPFQIGVSSFAGIRPASLAEGLAALLPYDLGRELDHLAPTHFRVPTGSNHAIRYDGEEPVLSVRVQELFGLGIHPAIAGGRLPLLLELLSPAHRPIQTTRDLPGFWAGSWRDVRAEMRGRYPKHPWPEDPANATPTTRAKPRS